MVPKRLTKEMLAAACHPLWMPYWFAEEFWDLMLVTAPKPSETLE
jgi:hypothetical protein